MNYATSKICSAPVMNYKKPIMQSLTMCFFKIISIWGLADLNPTLKLSLTIAANWTFVVGFCRITSWSWFPVRPPRPSGPVASDWHRRTEKTGRRQARAQTCSDPSRPDFTDDTCFSAASVSVPASSPSVHEYWERASEGEQTAQETPEEDGKVTAVFCFLFFFVQHFLLLVCDFENLFLDFRVISLCSFERWLRKWKWIILYF